MIQRFKIQWAVSFICIVFLYDVALGQVIIGAKGAGVGSATTALYEDEWGLFSNPASISAKEITVGFYGLRYYGFPEITDLSSVASLSY